MLNTDVLTILERDLNKLKDELRQYRNADDLWAIAPGTTNSAGNLALHLAGNLRHFIGAVLGHTGYIRDRESEFTLKNIPVEELIRLIDTTINEITPALNNLEPDKLNAEFPKEVGGMKRDTSFVLLHLLGHFSYHLGQVNYHRRIISSAGR